jgi:hypothetical protein
MGPGGSGDFSSALRVLDFFVLFLKMTRQTRHPWRLAICSFDCFLTWCIDLSLPFVKGSVEINSLFKYPR